MTIYRNPMGSMEDLRGSIKTFQPKRSTNDFATIEDHNHYLDVELLQSPESGNYNVRATLKHRLSGDVIGNFGYGFPDRDKAREKYDKLLSSPVKIMRDQEGKLSLIDD